MRLISFLLFVFLMMLVVPALASGDCNGPGACTDDDVIVGGSTVLSRVEGDKVKTFAVSGSPGDVDISDRGCVGSEQKGGLTIFWQKLVDTPWCMGIYYDQIGQYETAAKMRCSLDTVRDLFTTDTECIAGNKLLIAQPKNTGAVEEGSQEEDEDDDEFRQALADLRRDMEEGQKAQAERPPPVAVPARITKQIDEGAARRAAVRAILDTKVDK